VGKTRKIRSEFWFGSLKDRRLGLIWEEDTKLGRRESGLKGVNWIHLAQVMYQWRVLVNTDEPSGSIKGWEFLE
jgi:hypothetical protein